MLTCFCGPSHTKGLKSEIVKFVDRIWLDREGNVSCVRDFIVHVGEKSVPLTSIGLFTPYRNVLGIQDLTETCYDDNYLYNKSHTGGFKVTHIDPSSKKATVFVDGLSDVQVHAGVGKNLKISVDPIPPKRQANIIQIDCCLSPIQPGEFRHYRISFRINSLLEALFENTVYTISLKYFDGSDFRDEIRTLGLRKTEIPVMQYYKKSEVNGTPLFCGGLDIFLYLDPDIRGAQFNANREVVAKQQPDGTEGGKNRQKFIWRARQCFPDQKTLTLDHPAWELKGHVSDPYQLKRISERLDQLEDSSKTTEKDIAGLRKIVVILQSKIGDLWRDRKWLLFSVILAAVALGIGLPTFISLLWR